MERRRSVGANAVGAKEHAVGRRSEGALAKERASRGGNAAEGEREEKREERRPAELRVLVGETGGWMGWMGDGNG
jgi:hypothetical protein